MASAITLEGIDQAISNLEYKNKNTLKYRFVQHIRQYYTSENSVLLLNEIEHEALIKKLWDTDLSLEAVKNKRKNLNSVRSSVNSDLKKLYEKGKNPEGIKIGSKNIFVMSEDAKDKILKKLGHDIQPDDTLKLDQIMDILKLANEAVSGSMALEDTEKKDGVKKIDRLKDLVKGLSEKVGLASPELSKVAIEPGDAAGKGDEDGSGSMETAGVFEGELLDNVEDAEADNIEEGVDIEEDVEDVADSEDEIEYVDVENEEEFLDHIEDVEDITDPKDQVEYVDIADEEEVLGDVEDAETDDIEEDVEDVADLEDEVEYIDVADEEAILDSVADAETDDIDEAAEIEEGVEEGIEEVFDDENEELDDIEDLEIALEGENSEEQASGIISGDEDTLEDIGIGQGSGLKKAGEDIDNGIGDGDNLKDTGVATGADDINDDEDVAHDAAGKGDEGGSGSLETAGVPDEALPEEVEDVEDVADLEDDIEYVDVADEEAILDSDADAETDDTDEAAEIEEDVEEGIEEVFDDENEELDDVEDDAQDVTESAEYSLEEGKGQKGNGQSGLPVDSLGREYSIEADSKIKKNKLLAEEFDGHLGSMDRYYNQYILIPGGEYIVGNKHPNKNEKPEQKVYLEPFYLGRFPITNGLFEIFIEKTGYKTTAEKVGYGTVYYGRFEKRKNETTGLITSIWNASIYSNTVEGACWYQPSGPKSTLYNKRNHPVVQISLEDATAFAAWTGKRLPTENEWEAASRTANGWIFPWGQDWKKDACNIEDSYIADTTPVDKYIEFENDFGIVDILGNVLEWTDNSFEEMQQTNNREKYKAVRGGSWISGNDIRLYSRFMKEPESHSNIVGFRCVAY